MKPVTLENLQQTNHNHFQHKTQMLKNSKPATVRQSGKVRTWKTRPADFIVPVKYGMYTSFYITNENAHEWEIL